MRTAFDKFSYLIGLFLRQQLSAQEFSGTFINQFLDEKEPLPEPLFLLLDELFGDADSFTTDQGLLAENPGFYLDEKGLEAKTRDILRRMQMWHTRSQDAVEAMRQFEKIEGVEEQQILDWIAEGRT
ncbi:colicin immunity domain-containing protein [Duganella radicis]|nr:colicin immunity domain-containing protein [Duganella radicis]